VSAQRRRRQVRSSRLRSPRSSFSRRARVTRRSGRGRTPWKLLLQVGQVPQCPQVRLVVEVVVGPMQKLSAYL
jgi:hypothetical protein